MERKLYKTEKIRDLRELVRRADRLFAEKIAYKEIGSNDEVFDYTFGRLKEDTDALGTKLFDMGMKGYHIAVLGENSYRWVVSYLSIVNGLGVVVPLDKEMTDDEIAMLINKSDSKSVICSDTYADALSGILPKCPAVEHAVVMNPSQEYENLLDMNVLIDEGKEIIKSGNREYLDTSIDIDKMCEIVYTSGTTGANKGVMLSHKNIMTVIFGAMSLIKPVDTSFSVLPISHTYECSCHILGGIQSGLTICFNDSLKRVMKNIERFKPNFSVMVPLFLETMYRSIWINAEKNGLDKHLKYGLWFSNLLRKLGIDQRGLYFKPILEKFGGNLNLVVSGGAPLREEVIKGMTDFGIEVLNGYGITECAPLVSTNSVLWKKKGSVGRIIPGCEVKIDNPDEKGIGEVLVKGDNVMLGYYKDKKNTDLSFTADGWFKTGDLGYLDKQNFLYINGRRKNLIILANGKNISPEEIEGIVSEKIPYAKEVVVYSPFNKEGTQDTIIASIYIDKEYIITNGISNIKEELNRDIKLINRNLPVYKRIAKTLISETEFEKTATKKIKRDLVINRSAENV